MMAGAGPGWSQAPGATPDAQRGWQKLHPESHRCCITGCAAAGSWSRRDRRALTAGPPTWGRASELRDSTPALPLVRRLGQAQREGIYQLFPASPLWGEKWRPSCYTLPLGHFSQPWPPCERGAGNRGAQKPLALARTCVPALAQQPRGQPRAPHRLAGATAVLAHGHALPSALSSFWREARVKGPRRAPILLRAQAA